jgi:predicted porin
MQKKLIALAVAGLASTGALAQTNVTVYGIMDIFYAYNSADTKVVPARTNIDGAAVAGSTSKINDSSAHVIGAGGLSGSRLGFKGTEDLGGGLKANFVLEYGVMNDANTTLGEIAATGGSTSTGTRQAAVGLSGSWGSVNAGRLQSAAYDWDCTTAPLAGSGFDAKSKLAGHGLLACGGAGRVNSAVAYNSPNFGGFTFAVNHARLTENQNGVGTKAGAAAVAAANVPPAQPVAAAAATATLDNDGYANLIAGGYNNGPLAINAVWSKIDNSQKSVSAAGYFIEEVTEWGVSGSYNFGMLKLFGAYQNADFDVKSTTKSRNSDNDKWTIGVGVPVGANGSVSVQYADASIDKCTGTVAAATSATINQFNNQCDSDAWSIAYTHNLSKRTTLYGGYVVVSNDRNSRNAAQAQSAPDVGGDSSTFGLGVRHSF